MNNSLAVAMLNFCYLDIPEILTFLVFFVEPAGYFSKIDLNTTLLV